MNNIIVTLISDLWFNTSVINTIKYLLNKQNISVIDIDHQVQRNNLFQGSYLLNSVLKYYDAEVFHICLIGIQDQRQADLVYAEVNGKKIIALDNGFVFMLDSKNISLKYKTSYKNNNQQADCFSFINKALQIATNTLNINDFNPNTKITKQFAPKFKIKNNNLIVCDIIMVNYFNNLVVNLTTEEFYNFSKGRKFKYEYLPNQYVNEISDNLEAITHGQVYMIFNHCQYLEIGECQGNFANLLVGLNTFSACDYNNKTEKYATLFSIYKVAITFED